MIAGRLSTLLPPTRAGRVLVAGAGVDAIGTGMFMAAATLYFVTVVGIPVVEVGSVLAAANVCGLLSPVPVGRLAERLGAARVFVGLLVVRAVGYSAYVFVDRYATYLLLTCALVACDRASAPLLQAVVGYVVGKAARTPTMASIRAVRNAGMTAGFVLAGVVQSVGSRPAFACLFLIDGLSFLGIAACTSRVIGRSGEADATAATATAAPPPAPTRSPFTDRRFMALTLSEAVLALHDSVLLVLLPLWVVQRAGAPAVVASALLAVNTVGTVALQVFVSRFARDRRSAVRTLTVAAGLLVGACASFAVAQGRAEPLAICGAGVALVLLTLGENLHSVAGWELSYDMAPVAARPRYLAAFSLGHTVQRIVGPLLMTVVVLQIGVPGWLLLAALFVAAAALVRRVSRPARSPGLTGELAHA